MNTLFTAIATKIGMLPGNIYIIFNTSMLLLGFLFAKRYMGIGSILTIFVQGYVMNLCMVLFARMPWMFEGALCKTVSAALGYLLRVYGNALSTCVFLGTAGFEACLFQLADTIHIEYKYLKLSSEIIYFVAAMFLGGVYGIMTVIVVLFYGHGVSFFMAHFNRTFLKRWGLEDERNDLARNNRRRIRREQNGG